jgi:hypothetical protein
MGKIGKTFERRIHDLSGELRILRNALQKTESDDIYFYKVLAASLRTLVIQMKNNTPLLVDIAREMGLIMKVTHMNLKNVDGEIREVSVECTLEDYLEMVSCSHEGKIITVNLLIRAVADKDSLAHEDKELVEYWPTLEVMIGGDIPYFIRELKRISKDVLELGEKVVDYYMQTQNSIGQNKANRINSL